MISMMWSKYGAFWEKAISREMGDHVKTIIFTVVSDCKGKKFPSQSSYKTSEDGNLVKIKTR